MVHKMLRVFVLLLVVITPSFTSNPSKPIQPPSVKQETCPEPTEKLLACMRQWACQYLLRLDLRCLLNLNGLPLVGNALGGILGSGGQSAAQLPALGGLGGGLLGGSGGGLLGNTDGILGGILG